MNESHYLQTDTIQGEIQDEIMEDEKSKETIVPSELIFCNICSYSFASSILDSPFAAVVASAVRVSESSFCKLFTCCVKDSMSLSLSSSLDSPFAAVVASAVRVSESSFCNLFTCCVKDSMRSSLSESLLSSCTAVVAWAVRVHSSAGEPDEGANGFGTPQPMLSGSRY